MSFPPFSTRKTTNLLGPFSSLLTQTGKPPFSAAFDEVVVIFDTAALAPREKLRLDQNPHGNRNFQPPPGDETVGNY